jgi:dUTP pyrophosphatase
MENVLKIKIMKLHPAAIVPCYATDGAACFDLHALGAEWTDIAKRDGIKIEPSSGHVFRTGLAFEIPPGWAMLIYSRSGHGFKGNTRLANCVGVIDADYRGEVHVKLVADGYGGIRVFDGDRIAQAKLIETPRVEFEIVEALSETARGTGGFGSTGQRAMSDREWATLPSNLREGCTTTHVPGVGDL